MAKKIDIKQCKRAVKSFPTGKKILKEINKLPKKKQEEFCREFDKRGMGPITALKKIKK